MYLVSMISWLDIVPYSRSTEGRYIYVPGLRREDISMYLVSMISWLDIVPYSRSTEGRSSSVYLLFGTLTALVSFSARTVGQLVIFSQFVKLIRKVRVSQSDESVMLFGLVAGRVGLASWSGGSWTVSWVSLVSVSLVSQLGLQCQTTQLIGSNGSASLKSQSGQTLSWDC